MFSHWVRPRPRPREIARPIKMAYIELYEDVHTAPREYHWCHWFRHFTGFVIGLGVGQCEDTISTSITCTTCNVGNAVGDFSIKVKI